MPRRKNDENGEVKERKPIVRSDYFLIIAMDGGTCPNCSEEFEEIEGDETIKKAVIDGTVIWQFKKAKDLTLTLNRLDAKPVEDTQFLKLGCECLALVVHGKPRTVATRTISTLA